MEQLWPEASMSGARPLCRALRKPCCLLRSLGRHIGHCCSWSRSLPCDLKPPSSKPSTVAYWPSVSPVLPVTKNAWGLQSLAPRVCWPILYRACKPSGMLQALNFHEISGPLIVRQTEWLVTNSSPFTDMSASLNMMHSFHEAGCHGEGVCAEIDEDSTHSGKINMQEC